MKELKLVSIVTPCYNAEKYVGRLIESIIAQTYENLEFIVVNDGSKDKTEEVIMSYKDEVEKKGIKFIYKYQENAGVAGATQAGMRCISGDYVTWIDSDDWMSENSIQTKVEYLDKHPECALVCGRVQMVSETDMYQEKGILEYTDEAKENVFKALLMCEGVYYAPVGYMARTSFLKESTNNIDIYADLKVGQNWQLLLPITYSGKTGFINSIVGFYLVREVSHSHFEETLENIVEYNNNSQRAIVETLNRMKISVMEKEKYSNIVIKKYGNTNLRLYAKNGYIAEMKELFKLLYEKRLLKPKSYAYYIYGLIRCKTSRYE